MSSFQYSVCCIAFAAELFANCVAIMEEETLLLNNDINLPVEDAQKYFEAFKEFDPKDSGQVSLRELHLVFRRWLV